MNIIAEQLKQKIAKIRDTATERSYYPLLCAFFEEYAKDGRLKLRNPQATPEETSTQYEHKVGFPDITIRNGNDLIGWVEVKTPQENLNAEKFQEQFSKYKESLENIIFTNLREWQLWQWEEGESKKTAEALFDLTDINNASSEEFEHILIKFFEGRAYQTRTPKQLALALAKKTRLLSKQVEEALEKSEADSDLRKLKETFEKTLIQDISEHQFANMVAETMAYSLFLAALEHSRRDGAELTLTNAIDYLPTNVPILADLYSLIKKVSSTIPTIYEATRLLVDQLNASEIERIHQKLVEHKPGEDPVIQFYEPFLKEYDPKEREARGVYYTPKPVVDYIVKSVDWLLRNKFNKAKGLADESVHLLDPATGTGTFLMSAIQEIYGNIKKENSSLGDEMVKREFNRVVLSHILKHFYGFELLIAPYAIAHLKLTLEVERLGFDFANTKDDNDKDNDRFKVYLANTLDDPSKPPQKLFGFDSIPQESEKAREVKKNAPILAIIGNPPYSSVSTNIGQWIKGLVSDYLLIDGHKILEKSKRNNLQNDYVKFIRFAQWKLSQVDRGVIGFIADNSYLDGRTFRGMRKNLIDVFSEIYILNLHGDSKRKEKAADGKPDKNVFDITQGVAIIFLVKDSLKRDSKIYYHDLFANNKNIKFDWLNAHQLSNISGKISPSHPNYFLIPVDKSRESEWHTFASLTDVFGTYGTGVMTSRDSFVVNFQDAPLIQKMDDFYDSKISDEQVEHKYNLRENYVWKISKARQKFRQKPVSNKMIINYNYRPFDTRRLYYDNTVVFNPRKAIAEQFFNPNLGFMTSGQISTGSFNHSLVTKLAPDKCALSLQTREALVCAPLYLYKSTQPAQSTLSLLSASGDTNRQVNLESNFIKEFSQKLGFSFISNGHGDLVKTLGPEDIFYYFYAISHSPTYRSRYAEQLKIDFPHLPLMSDKKLFAQLVALGKELVNLHLLGENPFDKSKTILDEPEKWGIKIGGEKPVNLPDWQVADVSYNEKDRRVYVNKGQYFEGVEEEAWEFMVGGYQVCEKWLKDRKKAERALSTDDLKHYMKVIVALRETIRVMKEVDRAIPAWPFK